MCHHYQAATKLPEHFVAEFSIPTNQRLLYEEFARPIADGGAWPLKTVPGLRLKKDGEIEAFAAEWGLLPRWWKPSDKAPKRANFQRKTINARSETAAEKPAFRDAFKRRRCLLPVAEFFERGHYFSIQDDDAIQPVVFAGLWETWLGEDGEGTTCTLLTTEPNAEVRAVGHHRMPVLLVDSEGRRRWLGESEGALPVATADGVLHTREG